MGVMVELFCIIFGAVGDAIEKRGKPLGCLAMIGALVLSAGVTYLLVLAVIALARW